MLPCKKKCLSLQQNKTKFVPYQSILSAYRSMKALSPLVLFLVLFLGVSIVSGDFYKVPVTVAFLVSSVYAIALSSGSINDRIKRYSEGAGSPIVLLMVWIYILAGAFAASAKAMGAVDATVNLTLQLLPASLLLPGIFLAAVR